MASNLESFIALEYDTHPEDDLKQHIELHSSTVPTLKTPLEKVLWTYKDRVHGPLGIALCLIGVVLNLISCITWRKKEILVTGNVPLMAISVCQVIISCAFLPLLITLFWLTPLSAPKEKRNSYTNMIIAIVSNQVQLTAHATVLWLGVLMTFQRLLCITSKVPLQQNRLVSKNITQLSIIIIVVAVIVTSLPSFIVSELLIRSSHNNQSLISHDICSNASNVSDFNGTFTDINTDTGNSTNFTVCRKVVHETNLVDICVYYVMSLRPALRVPVHWIYIILHKILPCILMILLSGALVRSLRILVQKRDKLLGNPLYELPADDLDCGSKKSENKKIVKLKAPVKFSVMRLREMNKCVTKMLVVLVVLMVATQLPPALLLVIGAKEYRMFGDIFDVISMLDNIASFVLFCKMSTAFREEFVEQLRQALRFLLAPCSTASTKQT